MVPHIRFFEGMWECYGWHHLPRAIGETPSIAFHRWKWLMNSHYAPELRGMQDDIPHRPPLKSR